MSEMPRHLLMIAPVPDLHRAERIIAMVNSYCRSGSRVSVICQPQAQENRDELARLLHPSATVFAVPHHMPEAECYDLGHLLKSVPSSLLQRCSAQLQNVRRITRLIHLLESWPLKSGQPLQRILETWCRQIDSRQKQALADGHYWLHFLKMQLEPRLYRKYEKPFQMDCYSFFYFIQALTVNKSIAPIDAIFCAHLWSLPAGCLLKEILHLPLTFDSHYTNVNSLADPQAREVGRANEKWMYEMCDRRILPWETTATSSWHNFSVATNKPPLPSQLKIAMLYDNASTHTGTVYEHLNSFRKYLPHQLSFFHGTVAGYRLEEDENIDLSKFDAVILHYSLSLYVKDFLDERIAKQLVDFSGLKVAFLQDEYTNTENTRVLMDRVRLDVVYTCVPKEFHESVYPKSRFPKTEFINSLTGYVPEDEYTDNVCLPMRQREIAIAYRGRILPFIFGMLGNEKYRIGVDVKRFAEERGLLVDIEVDDAKRIYGDDWYRFLGSARATLGTESGSNVFDFDGTLKIALQKALDENPDLTFDEAYNTLIAEYEGRIQMNQISPKIFEAIRLRTALILFEGNYSGVVQPDLHYIPLKKDYSNIDDVFSKLDDLDYLEELTERAYKDIIETGKYSYSSFVKQTSADIEQRIRRPAALASA